MRAMPGEIKSQPPLSKNSSLPGVEVRDGDQEQSSFAQYAGGLLEFLSRIRNMLQRMVEEHGVEELGEFGGLQSPDSRVDSTFARYLARLG
jgi:hypothetical protein